MAMQRNPSNLFIDALYCEEEKWEDDEEATSEVDDGKDENSPPLFPLLLLEQDLFWEDEDLLSLFSKEDEEHQKRQCGPETTTTTYSQARREAVEWILQVNAHYSFTTLTAVLAVNYVDRFLSSLSVQGDEASKPWMVQLVAVTCLSLAAKVEETQVPLLLDLQVRTQHYYYYYYNC